MKEKTKEYHAGKLSVIWKPGRCIHSEKCWRGLPAVFKPGEKPWIRPEEASHQPLMKQIDQCPSGALSYKYEGEQPQAVGDKGTVSVEPMKNGPLILKGPVTIIQPDGSTSIHSKTAALCRCGGSGNKPYCDGSHQKKGFKA